MKFIFLLFVYFAGFATAVYMFVPLPEQQSDSYNSSYEQDYEQSTDPPSATETSRFAQSLNVGLHKFVSVAKAVIIHTADVVKQKLHERQQLAAAERY